MNTYGQITENEAIARGLLPEARSEVQDDGRVVCSHDGLKLCWRILPPPQSPVPFMGLSYRENASLRHGGSAPRSAAS